VFFVPASSVRRSVRPSKPVYFCSGEARPNGSGPVEVPADPDEVRRVSEAMSPEQRDELLEALVDRARYSIESGNGEAARDCLDTVRDLDPGYKGLGDLAREIERLSPGTGQQ
jgi:hypothetical protein